MFVFEFDSKGAIDTRQQGLADPVLIINALLVNTMQWFFVVCCCSSCSCFALFLWGDCNKVWYGAIKNCNLQRS